MMDRLTDAKNVDHISPHLMHLVWTEKYANAVDVKAFM